MTSLSATRAILAATLVLVTVLATTMPVLAQGVRFRPPPVRPPAPIPQIVGPRVLEPARVIGSDRRFQVVNTRITVDRNRQAGEITGLALDADSSVLLVSLGNGSLRWWDLERGMQFAHVRGANPLATALRLRDPNPAALVAQPDGTVLEIRPEGSRRTLSPPIDGFDHRARPALSGDDGVFVYRTGDSKWHLRPASGYGFVLPDAAPDAYPAISASGSMLAYVSGNRGERVTVRFARAGWNGFSLQCSDDGARITAVALNEHFVLAGDARGTVCLWKIPAGQVQPSLQGARRVGKLADAVRVLALDSTGRMVAAGDGRDTVRIWTVGGGGATTSEIRTFSTGRHSALIFASDSDWLLVGLPTGQVAIHSSQARQTGDSPVAQLLPTADGWSVIDANGRFDGSQNGIDALSVSGETNTETETARVALPVDAFSATHHEPALLQKIRGTEELLTDGALNLTQGFRRPPEASMRLGVPGPDGMVTVTVNVEAGYPQGNIGSIRLYHNGKLVMEARGQTTHSSRVVLVAGGNEFRAVAVDGQGIEGRPAVHSMEHRIRRESGADLHLVAIGIDTYTVPAWQLFYARKDAETVTRTVGEQGKSVRTGSGRPAYGKVHVHTLVESSADRNAITDLLKGLQTSPEDVLIVYFSGHGIVLKEQDDWEWYLVAYSDEWSNATSEEKLHQLIRKHALSARELMRMLTVQTQARRVFVVLDACYSGAAVKVFDDTATQKVLRQRARVGGIHVLAASQADERAKELPIEKHGALTWLLLEGMNGAADTNSDRQVSVREVVDYSADALVRFARKYYRHSVTQRPIAYSHGKEFGLVGL